MIEIIIIQVILIIFVLTFLKKCFKLVHNEEELPLKFKISTYIVWFSSAFLPVVGIFVCMFTIGYHAIYLDTVTYEKINGKNYYLRLRPNKFFKFFTKEF